MKTENNKKDITPQEVAGIIQIINALASLIKNLFKRKSKSNGKSNSN
jgi:hypothetical protein